MFFILSKILTYAVMPLVVVCGLLIASAVVKKASLKKKLFYIGLGLLLFCSNDFIGNEVMKLWELPVTVLSDVKKTYEYGIVLTGVTKFESGPNDRVYFTSGADRVTHALQLYKLGKIKKILISGGSGRLTAPQNKDAFEIAKAFAIMGVPQEDMVLEATSRNTHESAVEVKKILDGKVKPEDCLLITSAFHMRRSLACYEKVGWKMDNFTVDFLSHTRHFTLDVLIVPSVETLKNWHTLVREWVGMTMYKVAGYI